MSTGPNMDSEDFRGENLILCQMQLQFMIINGKDLWWLLPAAQYEMAAYRLSTTAAVYEET